MAIREVPFDELGQPSITGISSSFIVGMLITCFAYLTTSTIPFAHFRHPGGELTSTVPAPPVLCAHLTHPHTDPHLPSPPQELGPHLFGGLIVWRLVTNTAIM